MKFLTALYVRVRESRGQTMAEYALIMVAVAVACIAAYTALGGGVNTVINSVTDKLSL